MLATASYATEQFTEAYFDDNRADTAHEQASDLALRGDDHIIEVEDAAEYDALIEAGDSAKAQRDHSRDLARGALKATLVLLILPPAAVMLPKESPI